MHGVHEVRKMFTLFITEAEYSAILEVFCDKIPKIPIRGFWEADPRYTIIGENIRHETMKCLNCVGLHVYASEPHLNAENKGGPFKMSLLERKC